MSSQNLWFARSRVATVFALFPICRWSLSPPRKPNAPCLSSMAHPTGTVRTLVWWRIAAARWYGTTAWGGNTASGDYGGVVFKLSPPAAPGSPWVESVLYKFQGGDFSRDGGESLLHAGL